ncbi:MAG TPA: hypothetical protein PLL20_11880 [Phycisphaerae bacterium]|nr:hypothetical protein [Phycisphaerae bacterium]HRR83421.1 hypothetical protein [Phycisphaerae bacterium]
MIAMRESNLGLATTLMVVFSLSGLAAGAPGPPDPPDYDLYAATVWEKAWGAGQEAGQQFSPASSLPEAQRPPVIGGFDSFGVYINSTGDYEFYMEFYTWDTNWSTTIANGPMKVWRVVKVGQTGEAWIMFDLGSESVDLRYCNDAGTGPKVYPALDPLPLDGSYFWRLLVTRASGSPLQCWATTRTPVVDCGVGNIGIHGGGAVRTWSYQTRLHTLTPTCFNPRYDTDNDTDVDRDDFTVLQSCYTGAGIPGTWPYDDPCRCLDIDGDDDIDSVEYLAFDACALGSGVPADPACDDPQACCFADSSCQNLASVVCSDRGGTPQGSQTQCNTVACP